MPSSTKSSPAVAVMPSNGDLEDAVVRGGGRLSEVREADGLIWTDARHPERLEEALNNSPVRWVQLPFAGVERFLEAGVIDEKRTWTCAKGTYGPATAEHALALILAAARMVHHHARRTEWMLRREIPTLGRGDSAGPRRLAGTHALIAGAGGIGGALIPMLRGLQMKVTAVNRSGTKVTGADRTVATGALEEVLGDADWVVVAAPLTPETRGLIGQRQLELMRPGAWLINVARGGLVDTKALTAAIGSGQIAGAALDVTDPEPLPSDHKLWGFDNVLITSHTANTAAMALPDLCDLVERNTRRFAGGRPLEGTIDPKLGY